MRRSGEDDGWREGAADRKLWKKEWLDITIAVLDPHPCTAGNKGGRAHISSSTCNCNT